MLLDVVQCGGRSWFSQQTENVLNNTFIILLDCLGNISCQLGWKLKSTVLLMCGYYVQDHQFEKFSCNLYLSSFRFPLAIVNIKLWYISDSKTIGSHFQSVLPWMLKYQLLCYRTRLCGTKYTIAQDRQLVSLFLFMFNVRLETFSNRCFKANGLSF